MSERCRVWMAHVVPPVVTAFVLLGVWQLAASFFHDKPYLLPSPLTVWRALWRGYRSLALATLLTGRCALTGLAICVVLGTILGWLFGHSVFLRRGLYPYAVFLQTVPIIAIAPLIINWLGPGFASMVTVVVVVSIFPVMANVAEGLLAVPAELRELFAVYGARRYHVLWKLEFPFVIPYLLTGARISGGLSVIGAIVGEFFAGYGSRRPGLGFLIPQRIQWLKTDEAFAAVLAATLLGLAIFVCVTWLRDGPLAKWCNR